MKKVCRILWLATAMMFAVQASQSQVAIDALRYSQLGLGVGARQLGMGNATVGGVDDYSALFWNPAGLALERKFEFSFGLSWMDYSNSDSYFDTKTSSDKKSLNLNNLGFVYPIPTSRGSLTIAFGFNRAANYAAAASMDAFNPSNSIVQSTDLFDKPYYSNIPIWLGLAGYDTLSGNWYPRVTGNVQQLINVLEGGGLNHWTVGGAVDIGKNLSFGVSLNIAAGSYSYDRTFTESDVRHLYVLPPSDFSRLEYESTYNDDLSGFNALFGLMFRKPGKYSIGVAFRTPTVYDISETYSRRATSQFKTAVDGASSYVFPNDSTDPGTVDFRYRVTTPYVLSAGINIHPLEWLVLAGDLEYTDWTQMEFRPDNDQLVTENSTIKNNMQATTNLRGGLEITLAKLGIKLRGGIIDNPSPWKGDPSSRDQLYYTGGIGFMLDENTTLNVGYAYGTWKFQRTNYSYPDASNNLIEVTSDEAITTSNLNVTLMYRF